MKDYNMKRFGIISGLALAALALTNCAKEVDTTKETIGKKDGVPFSIIAMPSEETKTIAGDNMSTLWDAENDKLNVFHKASNASEFNSDGEFTVADASLGTFTGTIEAQYAPTAGNNYDWVAIYPYYEGLNTFAPSNKFYYVGCRSDKAQIQDGKNSTAHLAGYGFAGDNHHAFPLWGKKENVPFSSSDAGTFVSPVITMNQVCSVLAFNIKNSTSAPINITRITFTATEDIVGAYNINFSGETPTFTKPNDYQSATVTLDVTNATLGVNETGIFYAGIKPFTVEGTDVAPKTLSMTVYTEGGEVQTKEFSIKKTMTFSPNKYKNVNMEFTTEHVDAEYIQITTLGEFISDAEYMLVLPDGGTTGYYAVKVNGTTGSLTDITSGISTDSKGRLTYTSPNSNLVWSIAGTVSGGHNFRNGEYCIFSHSKNADVDTKYSGSCYWTPAELDGGFFSLKSGERYLCEGTTTTLVKAYDHFINQVAEQSALPLQYAGAWIVLRHGGVFLDEPGLSFAQSTVELTLGDSEYLEFQGQTISNPHNLTITSWTSDNTALATVNNNGEVSLVANAQGSAKITAYFAGNDSYKAGKASYTITVSQASPDWVVTSLANLTSSDIFVIVGRIGNGSTYYAMTNDNGTGAAPSAINITSSVSGDVLIGNIANNIKWKVSGNASDGYTFYPNGDSSNWLYCTNTNNGARVGTNENKTFTFNNKDYLVHTATSRTLSIYSSTEWRCYGNENNNPAKVKFYKYVGGGSTPISVATPSFSPGGGSYSSAQSVTISCSTDGATIYYTTDSSTPTSSSTVYSSAINIATTSTLKAIAIKDGLSSEVASATYTITGGGGSSTTITFTAGTDISSGLSLTKSGITLTITNGTLSRDDNYRAYAGSTMTISASGANITGITFNCNASGTSKGGPGQLSTVTGNYSYNDRVGTWTGSASSIEFSVNQQCQINSFTVTYE